MAPRINSKLKKKYVANAEQVPAWVKAMENRLEAKIEDLNGSKDRIIAALESKISSLQEEFQRKSKKSRAPILKYHENIKQFDFLNQLEDVVEDLECYLQLHTLLDAATKAIIDKGKSLISNRKNLIYITDREGSRVARFYEMEGLILSDVEDHSEVGVLPF